MDPFVRLRVPLIIDLKMDPFERAPTDSNNYYHWLITNAFLILQAQEATARFVQSFREFPPRQEPASFNVDQILRQMTQAAHGVGK